MKIGDFARKFNQNVSTVRFYVNNGLLLPKIVNGRYDFDSQCVKDMERIMKYKTFHFTLEEIQLLFFMEKASGFKDEVIVQICAEILRNKKEELIEYREKLSDYLQEIDEELSSLSLSPDVKEGTGVPFSFIPDLYCPKCQVPLKLEDARLMHNSLDKGRLWCDCGYEAHIEEGIIKLKDCVEETPFKAFENVESVISMKEQFSPSYRLLIGKAYQQIYQNAYYDAEEAKHVLFGPFTFNFLLEYLDRLGTLNTYIIFDPSVKRMEKLKKYLSSSSAKIVFIAGLASQLPLRHRSCNLYIDDYSTVNHLFTYSKYPCEEIGPLIKKNGIVTGIFSVYDKAPETLRNFKEFHPQFPFELMKLFHLRQAWERSGFEMYEEKEMGITTGNEIHSNMGVLGEQIGVWTYSLKKTDRRK
ncbi:MAG: MerR family transcriptional regulator [Anaerovoracaceae bacterium]|nr:MerR family transcriptional regulator [Clostridiales bacterium]